MTKLTTHVLDIYSGKPGKGIKVDLYYYQNDDKKIKINTIILNNDGRISTKTASKLQEQFGFDAAGIRQLQDELNNMLITRSVIRTQDDGKDTVNKMVE